MTESRRLIPRRFRAGRSSPPRWPAVVLGALALASCTSEKPPPPPSLPAPSNILLVTIDTLRADHLSSYGYARPTSPVIDRLAAEGVRFDQAAAQWPKTGPSFASIFTSTYPKDNGIVRRVGMTVPRSFRLLAEVLQQGGYTTHAVVANGALGSEFNYHQGFDTYVETWKQPGAGESGKDNNPAGRVNELVFPVAEAIDREKPFFLWVHYIDPHFPYEPPEPWRDRFQNDEHFTAGPEIWVNPKSRRQQMRGIGHGMVLDGRNDLGFYVARYDAEIAYVDEQLGLLLERLGELGLLESTLTVLTSDHGESLGEHKYFFGHGRLGVQPGLRVPFIVHYPGVIEPRIDHDPVELLHLTPTLLEAAGARLEGGRWMQGRSLWPRLLGSAAPAAELAFSEAGEAAKRNWQRVVRDRRFKLIYAPAGAAQRWLGGKGRPLVMYDLETDPGETENVAESFPEERRRLEKALSGWWNAEPFDVRLDGQEGDEDEQEMDTKTRDQLRALGYIE